MESALGDHANLQTVERAVRLLQHVVFERQTVGTRESARILGISPSSAHRLLRTLAELDLLMQDGTTSEFGPGTALYRLAATLLASNDISKAARGPMEKLARQTGEAVFLCLRHKYRRIALDIVRGWRQLQYALPLGEEVPLHVGSSGLAILAWLPDDEILDFIKGGLPLPSPRTITDPQELHQALQTIRSQGFAVSYGHYIEDGVGVSAPFFGAHGEVLGSVLLTIPEARLAQHGPLHEIGRSVQETADTISLYLGGQANARDFRAKKSKGGDSNRKKTLRAIHLSENGW